MIALALVLALGASDPAGAPPPAQAAPPAAQAAPSATEAPEPPRPVRIEHRLLEKRDHFFAVAGPGWLARADYYLSPSLGVSITRYLYEGGGPELRAIAFFSSLSRAARDVRDATGLVPDAQRPEALFAAGWRQSIGYGKMLVSPELGVVHFDLQLSAAAGVLRTDRTTTPVLLGGPGVLARIGSRFVAQLDLGVQASFERRVYASVTGGILATLAVGAWL